MKYILCALIPLMTACNQKLDPRNGFLPAACPSSMTLPYHEVTVNAAAIPVKVAVYINGVLEADECASEPKEMPAPIVEVTRERAALKIKVIHGDAYPVLPSEMALEIQDRGACNSSIVFLKEDHIPLTFAKEFPYGKKCGAVESAKVELTH